MKKIFTLAVCSLALVSCANKNISAEQQANAHMTGAYTNSRSVSKQEKTLFNETYKGEVPLTPLSVSTQVVAGTNYKFLCKDKKGNKYQVVIYQKLPCYGGEAEVTSVETIDGAKQQDSNEKGK